MQAEKQAQLVRNATDGDFGSRIASLDSSHHLASPAAVHDIDHDVGIQSSRWYMSEAVRIGGDLNAS